MCLFLKMLWLFVCSVHGNLPVEASWGLSLIGLKGLNAISNPSQETAAP